MTFWLQKSSEVTEGHKRSNLKNGLRETILGMHTHVVSLTHTGYDILTLKLRSLDVIRYSAYELT